ncbi:MAG: FAD:protein FMN transferase [Planctomycetota bacterium]
MSRERHSRRDFLRGRAALAEATDAIESTLDAHLARTESPETRRTAARVLTLRRRAMACDFELRLNETSEQNDTAAGMAALDCIEQVEDQLTVYRDTSDLIELNRRAAEGATIADPSLFALLQQCQKLHEETNGAFDPTSGPLSRVWGFHRREGQMPSDEQREDALTRVGWNHVRLNAEDRSVRFAYPGIEINSNSIGKGYSLDRAAEVLAEQGVADSLMHGGRSTLLARGNNATLPNGGWKTGLRDPLNPTRRVAEFTLRDEALSTSGSGTQFFEHEGRRYGHLIDPRTGWPAEGLYSASVIAPTAAEADALSTAAYILGIKGTAKLCERRPDISALLLAPAEGDDGKVEVAVHAFNLEADQWQSGLTA